MKDYLPTIVYAIEVYNISQIAQVPFGRSFTISSNIAKVSSALISAGASAGAVGIKRGTSGNTLYTFRFPNESESIWLHGSDNLYRWLKGTSGSYAWSPYKSMAQRTIEGLPAFTALDKDGVYRYVAKLIGAIGANIRGDCYPIARIRDSRSVPAELLTYAASQVGALINDSDPAEVQRSQLEIFPLAYNARGSVDGVESYLASRGYIGRALEVYELMKWPSVILSNCSKVLVSNTDSINRLEVSDHSSDTKLVYFVNGNNPAAATTLDMTVNRTVYSFIFYNGVYSSGSAAAMTSPANGSIVVITSGTTGTWLVQSNNGANFPSDYIQLSSALPIQTIIVIDPVSTTTASNLAGAINAASLSPVSSTVVDFTVSTATPNPRSGDRYTNNGSTFEVMSSVLFDSALAKPGTIRCRRINGSSLPTASGTLTRSFGYGASSFSYSVYAVTNAVSQNTISSNFNSPFQVWPHGTITDPPLNYWPAPYMAVFTANHDYTFTRLTSIQQSNLRALTLPAHATVWGYGQISRAGTITPISPQDPLASDNYLLPDYVNAAEVAVGTGFATRQLRIRQAVSVTGTVSQAAYSSTIVGSGTSFTTQLQSGDILIFSADPTNPRVVGFVTDNVTATVDYTAPTNTASSSIFLTRKNLYPSVNDGWNPA